MFRTYSTSYYLYARAQYYQAYTHQLDFLKQLKTNPRTNPGISKGSETEIPRHKSIRRSKSDSALIIFCLGDIWKVILKRGENGTHKNSQSR